MMQGKALLLTIGVTSCGMATSDAAFCGPSFSGAIDQLENVLPNPQTPDEVGVAATVVILKHEAGCT